MLIFNLLISCAFAAAPGLTTADLVALQSQAKWIDLLNSCDQVQPESRDAKWKSVVSNASSENLKQILVLNQVQRSPEELSGKIHQISSATIKTETDFPFVMTSSDYMKTKLQALVTLISICSDEKNGRLFDCAQSITNLSGEIKTLPKGVAQKAVAIMKNRGGSSATQFQYRILDAQERHDGCKDKDFQYMIFENLTRPAKSPELNLALSALETCKAETEDELMNRFTQSAKGETFEQNVCPLLKKRGKSTMLIRAKCL
ncbi:MAG: hypothetical protein ACXVA9_13830 [Bdellovibrionales bacterium]